MRCSGTSSSTCTNSRCWRTFSRSSGCNTRTSTSRPCRSWARSTWAKSVTQPTFSPRTTRGKRGKEGKREGGPCVSVVVGANQIFICVKQIVKVYKATGGRCQLRAPPSQARSNSAVGCLASSTNNSLVLRGVLLGLLFRPFLRGLFPLFPDEREPLQVFSRLLRLALLLQLEVPLLGPLRFERLPLPPRQCHLLIHVHIARLHTPALFLQVWIADLDEPRDAARLAALLLLAPVVAVVAAVAVALVRVRVAPGGLVLPLVLLLRACHLLAVRLALLALLDALRLSLEGLEVREPLPSSSPRAPTHLCFPVLSLAAAGFERAHRANV
mmetsp:Transcript_13636/g.34259  ORF Transcript_13636/g.34259 Transcript_13636/m.34259 type:complete len:327 (+) Transcript_13636:1587-2567(+)